MTAGDKSDLNPVFLDALASFLLPAFSKSSVIMITGVWFLRAHAFRRSELPAHPSCSGCRRHEGSQVAID
jgi:hypothetical protein